MPECLAIARPHTGRRDRGVGRLGARPPPRPSASRLTPASGLLPGPVHYPLQYSGLENSMDYSPWGRKESDTTE